MTIPDLNLLMPFTVIWEKKDTSDWMQDVSIANPYRELTPGAVYQITATSHGNANGAFHISTAKSISSAYRIRSHSIPAGVENFRMKEFPVAPGDTAIMNMSSVQMAPGERIVFRIIPMPML
ncbi:hypothetical protein [Corynebacterium sp.]|uniref:hypothetical protein n=1 Tax=Corynebacterium sp. TaxID=1720 RepID=UPI0028AB6928|nr:hypothetical protein [Corynebacterium sp.]